MKGYVQVYTGDGKGKTTAAIGLAIRAVGAGFHVFIGQFVKGMKYNELTVLKDLSRRITVKQYGRDCFIYNDPTDRDVEVARRGFEEIKTILTSGKYQLVILDEANIAVYYKLFSVEELVEAIKNRSPAVEVVVTGRKAEAKLIEIADLVTDMREIKHYYSRGVEARDGIEK
jgi:cob(I)alamin adenosyltransferase